MNVLAAIASVLVIGSVIGSVYSVAATGLVITYRMSGVFNFAHGALGMFAAFFFSWLVQRIGLPIFPAMLVTVLGLAPVTGVLLHFLIFRPLRDAPTVVKIVVTIGLLVALQGLASTFWGRAGLSPQQIFPTTVFRITRGLAVGADQIGVVALGTAVSIGLWLLLAKTRFGVTMRAVVDRPELAELGGISAGRVAAGSWVLGSALAALAGIMLTPQVSLEVFTLTLIVINAYAAAMVGRLESLPLTFAGGVLLGVLETIAVRVLPANVSNSVRPSISFVLLFALLLIPRKRKPLREPREAAATAPPRQLTEELATAEAIARRPLRDRAIASGGLLLIVLALPAVLGAGMTFTLDLALTHAIIFLSLVILVGYGGQISLGQAALAGVGGVVTAHLVSGLGLSWFFAVPLAGLAAVPVGALLAYPALRLHGLFLGLATMAFALLMDNAFFARVVVTGGTTGIRVDRPAGVADDHRFYYVLAALFALLAWGAENLKRGRTGRILAAMRDSETGARSVGISMKSYKVAVFAMSSFVAGVGGAAHTAMFGRVSSDEFQIFFSLVWLAVAVVGGISSWFGALIGGLVYEFVPYLIGQVQSPTLGPVLNDLVPVFFGVAAIALARNPHGIATVPRRIVRGIGARARNAMQRLEEEEAVVG
jgi:branched-chain amino acid transport system permease protein